MFLKVISANLRGSISIYSTLGTKLTHTRNKLLQLIPVHSSTLQYSTEKPGSSLPISASKAANKNDELSQEEIHVLNQDPNSFGTLSSFKAPVEKIVENESVDQPKIKEKSASKPKPSSRKSNDKYEPLLKGLINEKNVQEAVRVFEEDMLKTGRFLAPIQIYEWLIDECLRINYYEKAFDLYEHMVNRGLKISLPIIEKLTVAFESTGYTIKKVNSLRKIISKYEYEMNSTVYNAMIRIYIRANQWPTSFELAEELTQRNFNYEFVTINSMLEACKFDENNGFNRLLELWHEMHRLGYTPNTHTFNAILHAVHRCEIKDFDKLLETVESIKIKWKSASEDTNSTEGDENVSAKDSSIDDGRPNLLKIPPTIGHLFPLKDAVNPEKRLLILGGLSEFLTMFRVYEILPTLEILKTLLKVSPDSFDAQQKSIRLLLKKHNILPDAELFHILLTKACHRQNFKDAIEIIDMMYSLSVEVDLVSYGLLSMTCKTADDANEFFNEAERNNVKLEEDIMNAMLKNACTTGNNDFVISILRKMQSKKIEPLEESVRLVEEYQQRVFQNLRTQRVHSKQTRNECFKLTRECKQFLKYFQLDKRLENELSKRINVPVKDDKKQIKKQMKVNSIIGINKIKTPKMNIDE